MFTDTHAHLADPALATQLPEVLQQAQQAGVTRFIVPATHAHDWQAVLTLSAPNILPAMGIHPWWADGATDDDFAALAALLVQHSRALVGEIGLDYHRARSDNARLQQQNVFCAQLQLAQQYQRPIILHNLRATNDIVRLIKATGFKQGGLAHAFSGSLTEAKSLIEQGFLIGIGSLLLNPHAQKVRVLASKLPLQYMVLETDSPFMLPNHRNQPANIRAIAEIVCQLRAISLAELATQTECNIQNLLGELF